MPRSGSTKCSSLTNSHSVAIAQFCQGGSDSSIELPCFRLLFAQYLCEPLHLLLERFAVVLGGFSADVAAWREHMSVLANVLEFRGLREAGDVRVFGGAFVGAPSVISAGNLREVLVPQLSMHAIGHRA